MKMRRSWHTILLFLLLCFSLAACGTGEDEPVDTGISFAQSGIQSQGKIEAKDFPDIAAFAEWYAQAAEREQLTNALLCEKDESDGLWYCWLYLGSYTEGDAVELGSESEQGTVLIRHTAKDAEGTGATCVFAFTVDRDADPAFELYQNGDFAGLVITKGK